MSAAQLQPARPSDRPRGLRVTAWAPTDAVDCLATIAIAPAAGRLRRSTSLPLPSLGGTSRAEFWQVPGPVARESDGVSELSHNGDLLFGRIVLEEASAPIEDLAAAGYRSLLDCNARFGYPHLLRVWNYFGAINAGEDDQERYRRFCIGRGRTIPSEPATGYAAATAIGIPAPPKHLHLHWLAGQAAGVALENPRQVSAWEYPREYGPVAPGFSRAMLLEWCEVPLLLVSGTASVLGHASMHGGVLAQLAETLTNLETLVARAAQRLGRPTTLGADTLLRVYVRHPSDAPRILTRLIERFGNQVPFLLLHGDICRRPLLVEIEAVHRFT